MMKKIVLFIVISLFSVNCKGQQKDTLTNNLKIKDTMEYFNMNNYKKLKLNPEYSPSLTNFLDENGDNIKILSTTNGGAVVDKEKKNSPYRTRKIFHKNTSLEKVMSFFYNVPVGVYKEYDEERKLIKEKNYDNDYKFPIEALIAKMKEEYNVDLLNIEQTHSVSVYNNEYLIICDQRARNTFYHYVIDWTTGQTLSIKILDPESNYEKVILDVKADRTKKNHEDNSYFKTYKGKDYTKKEWEIFEAEWYKDYQQQKNKKGFWR